MTFVAVISILINFALASELYLRTVEHRKEMSDLNLRCRKQMEHMAEKLMKYEEDDLK